MSKKIILTIFLSFIVFNVFSSVASAAEIIYMNDPGKIYKDGPYYSSSHNAFRVSLSGRSAQSLSVQYYPDKNFTIKGTHKQEEALPNQWLVSVNLRCFGGYDVKVYSASGVLLLEYRIWIEESEFPNASCQSDGSPDEEEEDNTSGCANLICECVMSLEKPLIDIKDSVDGVKDSVDGVKNELTQLNQTTTEIKDVLVDFSEEFKTDIEYKIPDSPNLDNILEENKPVQNEKPFIDDNIYFKDEGDAPDADPGKLPQAPDIKDWDGFKPELPFPPEAELKLDKENVSDKELNKDDELKQDQFEKTPEFELDKFEKTPELELDKFEKTPEFKQDNFEKTPEFKQDNFEKSPEFNNTHIYGQTNKF